MPPRMVTHTTPSISISDQTSLALPAEQPSKCLVSGLAQFITKWLHYTRLLSCFGKLSWSLMPRPLRIRASRLFTHFKTNTKTKKATLMDSERDTHTHTNLKTAVIRDLNLTKVSQSSSRRSNGSRNSNRKRKWDTPVEFSLLVNFFKGLSWLDSACCHVW